MAAMKSTLSDAARQVAANALQNTLVDLLGLSLIGKQIHWNVVGSRFRSVHLQLDELVTEVREAADQVAERAATLGVPPDGCPATIASAIALPVPQADWVRDDEAIEIVTEALHIAATRLRKRIEATENSDPVTQDLLISVTAELEKQHWMFASGHAAHAQ